MPVLAREDCCDPFHSLFTQSLSPSWIDKPEITMFGPYGAAIKYDNGKVGVFLGCLIETDCKAFFIQFSLHRLFSSEF